MDHLFLIGMRNPQIIGSEDLRYLVGEISFIEIRVSESMSCKHSMKSERHLLKIFYLQSSSGEQFGIKLISLRFRVSKRMT